MKNLVKIEGYSRLRKNTSTGAVLNVDTDSYNTSKRRRESALKQIDANSQLRNDVDSLRQDMLEIKNILTKLINTDK